MGIFKREFHWKFPNLTLLAVSIAVTIYLLRNGWLQQFTSHLDGYGYIGVFITGFLFVSTFTVAPAAAVLFTFAKTLDPIVVAIVGGLGGMFGDWLGFVFVRDRIISELNPFLKALHLYRHINIVNSKYFGWFAPVLGAGIIASPFPDELGLTLLGMTKVKLEILLPVIFILNTIGILLIAIAARA